MSPVPISASHASDYFSQDECRWAVYDVTYEKDGGKRNKLTFYIWYICWRSNAVPYI
jgi:hypothetical protein